MDSLYSFILPIDVEDIEREWIWDMVSNSQETTVTTDVQQIADILYANNIIRMYRRDLINEFSSGKMVESTIERLVKVNALIELLEWTRTTTSQRVSTESLFVNYIDGNTFVSVRFND
jgi:hypothetical protein